MRIAQVGAMSRFEDRDAPLFMGAVVDERVNQVVAIERDEGVVLHERTPLVGSGRGRRAREDSVIMVATGVQR